MASFWKIPEGNTSVVSLESVCFIFPLEKIQLGDERWVRTITIGKSDLLIPKGYRGYMEFDGRFGNTVPSCGKCDKERWRFPEFNYPRRQMQSDGHDPSLTEVWLLETNIHG
jgi:hypothetical protein